MINIKDDKYWDNVQCWDVYLVYNYSNVMIM